MPSITPTSKSPAASLLSGATATKSAAPGKRFDQALRSAAQKPPKAVPPPARRTEKANKLIAKKPIEKPESDDATQAGQASQSPSEVTDASNQSSTGDPVTNAAAHQSSSTSTASKPENPQIENAVSETSNAESPDGQAILETVSSLALPVEATDDAVKPKPAVDRSEGGDPLAEQVSDVQLSAAQVAVVLQPATVPPIKPQPIAEDAPPKIPVAPVIGPKAAVKTQPAAPAKSNPFVTKITTVASEASNSGENDQIDLPTIADEPQTPSQTTQVSSVTTEKKAPPQLPKFALQVTPPSDASPKLKADSQPLAAPAPTIASAADAAAFVEAVDSTDVTDPKQGVKLDDASTIDPSQLLATDKPTAHVPATGSLPHAPVSTAADVTANNHDHIVQVIKSDLTPGGGSMKIRLDPPELGALQVTVKMSEGVMTASFETSSDQATKMLSHSLGQLKTALESAGVSVEKLHVQQAPKDFSNNNNGDGRDDSRHQQARGSDTGEQQREQQRREMIRRMWAKLGVGDPLDLVA